MTQTKVFWACFQCQHGLCPRGSLFWTQKRGQYKPVVTRNHLHSHTQSNIENNKSKKHGKIQGDLVWTSGSRWGWTYFICLLGHSGANEYSFSSALLRISSKTKELINAFPFAPLVTCVTSPKALDSLNVFKIIFLFMCFLRMGAGGWACHDVHRYVRGKLEGICFSTHHVNLGVRIQIIRVKDRSLSPLNHLTGPSDILYGTLITFTYFLYLLHRG